MRKIEAFENESKNERVKVKVRIRLTTHQLAQWINGGDSTLYDLVYGLFPLHEFDEDGEQINHIPLNGNYVEYDDVNDCAYMEYTFFAEKASE